VVNVTSSTWTENITEIVNGSGQNYPSHQHVTLMLQIIIS